MVHQRFTMSISNLQSEFFMADHSNSLLLSFSWSPLYGVPSIEERSITQNPNSSHPKHSIKAIGFSTRLVCVCEREYKEGYDVFFPKYLPWCSKFFWTFFKGNPITIYGFIRWQYKPHHRSTVKWILLQFLID